MLKSQEHVMTEHNFLIWGQTHTIKFLILSWLWLHLCQ